jgi:sulfonate transport system substrate-binding protein
MRSLAFVFVLTAACSGESKQASAGDSAGSTVDRTTLRIGYQKNGVLVIARERGVVEREIAPLGLTVSWIEFAAGPPMLEAMSAGSIDFGQVGDTPPIFAQASGGHVVYVAGQPSTNGQGILVRSDAGIRSLADLKGRRIGFTKGSSAHNVVLMALDRARLSYDDITPVYLSPPDAASAFASGNIDGWAIWDPYYAIGQKHGGQILIEASALGKTHSFFIGNREFVARNTQVIRHTLAALENAARWAESHRDDVARSLAAITRLDLETQTVAANRSSFAIGTLTDDIIENQQVVADRLFRIGLIPRPVVVRDAVWFPPQS